MLTQKSTPAEASSDQPPAADPHAASSQRDLGGVITYFEGSFVPLRDAKVSVMTHAFMYGTATFEGIRGYWNAEHGKLYVLKLREHVERIRQSCRILLMNDVPSVDELAGLILETVARNDFHEDVYIRPSFYKSTIAIGVRLHNLDNQLYIIAIPFGIGITCLHYDLAVKFRAVLLSEGRQRSVGNRNQDDLAKSQRLFDRTARGVRPAGSHQAIEITRMAGTETDLVPRLCQELTNQAANMPGTDNSDFHAATSLLLAWILFVHGSCRKENFGGNRTWEIQPNQTRLRRRNGTDYATVASSSPFSR